MQNDAINLVDVILLCVYYKFDWLVRIVIILRDNFLKIAIKQKKLFLKNKAYTKTSYKYKCFFNFILLHSILTKFQILEKKIEFSFKL